MKTTNPYQPSQIAPPPTMFKYFSSKYFSLYNIALAVVSSIAVAAMVMVWVKMQQIEAMQNAHAVTERQYQVVSNLLIQSVADKPLPTPPSYVTQSIEEN